MAKSMKKPAQYNAGRRPAPMAPAARPPAAMPPSNRVPAIAANPPPMAPMMGGKRRK
jgi:hypothetical protein